MDNVKTAAALCAVGAEKTVSNELRKLGLKVEDSLYGKVRFKADAAGLYRALIGLRAADRVLLEMGFFPASDFDALFEGARSAPWEEAVPNGMGLTVVKVRSNRSQLKSQTSIQSVVHKAAAERLCAKYKVRRLPETGRIAEVRVYVEKDHVSLLLDLSGEPLFKRGYRGSGGPAPLRETTAASILLISGWKRKFPLYDPFCGSGTILIEAAMYAWDMAPGLGRGFAINELLIADRKTELNVRDDFRGKIDFDRVVRIAGSDNDAQAVSIAKSNINRLLNSNSRDKKNFASGVSLPIEIKVLPVENAAPQFAGADAGFIITNPPYGRRLGDQAESEQLYGKMKILEQPFSGWKLGVITDHEGFESFFGRKANDCRPVSNGAIPSYFFMYDVL
jgi:putative N6-adenine-specific DNA methylase